MIYQSTAERKNQHGMLAYYKTGFTLLFREPFVPFEAEILLCNGEVRQMPILDVMVVRVESFGGLLKRWRPGGSLLQSHLHLLVNHGARRGDLFRYVMSAMHGSAMDARRTGIHFGGTVTLQSRRREAMPGYMSKPTAKRWEQCR